MQGPILLWYWHILEMQFKMCIRDRAKDADEFLDIIDKAENERFGEEEKKTQAARCV